MKKTIRVKGVDTEWLYVPDVVYASYEGMDRTIQLFVPYRNEWQDGNERFPLIVFIPGSAWYRQELYNSLPAYSNLAERGFVTAVVQYRESTIAKYPAQVEDVEKAVDFLVSKAEAFHIDTDRIYLGGNSSGGHIALMTALRSANGIKDSEGFQSSVIKGVIAESAPADLFLCATEPLPDFMASEVRPSARLLGVGEIGQNTVLAKEAGCEMYISREVALPPVLLLHGTADCQVSVEHSRKLYELLTAFDKDVLYYELEGTDHNNAVFWKSEMLDIIEAFVRQSEI